MAADLVGQTISRYRVLDVLGVGGMGVVYRAEDSRLGRAVALKFLSTSLEQDPIALRQFQREARATSSLNHPSICTVYEVDEWNGQPFIAMELLNGQTLRERVASARFEPLAVVDVAIQIAGALGAAHDKGILHRDVKPANIFLTETGSIKLLDFGLAKRMSLDALDSVPSTGFTEVGRLLGTANYMAPERLRGRDIDARSDLFSLGAVLFELLARQRAFDGASVIDVIEAILQRETPTIDAATGPWPKALVQIITKLLEKSPDDRYQSATALTTALVALREDLAAGKATMVATMHDAGPRRASIAVLPFRNLGAEPEQEYFGDGLAEELITALTKIERLKVAGRASAFAFKGRNAELREIGARLKVESVLSGSVRRAGSRMRVSCQLTNVADGYQIWSDRYDREITDVFELQDEMTRTIVEQLKVTLVDRLEPARRYTDSRESYHHYLRGRFYWSKRYEGGLKKALDEFQLAIDQDRGNALAYSGQADVFAFLGLYSLMPPRQAFDRARVAASTALAIDDALPEAHTSLGLIALSADWNFQKAEAEFLRAIELDRTQAIAHMYYAWLLALSDRRTEAILTMRRAQDVDPLNALVNSAAGWMYFLMRDYDKAIAECQKCVEMDPTFLVGLYVMAMAHSQKAQYDQALPLIEQATTLSGRAPFYLGLLGQIYAETGRRADVARVLAELETRAATTYIPPHCFVYIYASQGDKDRAFAWQEKACADGAPPFYFMSPAIGMLHDDPRHKAHLARMRSGAVC
jgi:TolB-like protein/Tfp pilus assembly protein PilF